MVSLLSWAISPCTGFYHRVWPCHFEYSNNGLDCLGFHYAPTQTVLNFLLHASCSVLRVLQDFKGFTAMFTKPSKLERYRELELIPAELYPEPSNGWKGWRVIRAIAHWISAITLDHNEPRIFRGIDDTGALYWRVYDPVTRDSARLYDEGEVRAWIEDRYHCRSRAGMPLPNSAAYRLGGDRLWH
jgi:hypothetical protein